MTQRFSTCNLDIILSLNDDNCYIEILDTVSFNRYSLSIDKLILDDIRVIPNHKQMFKILTSLFDNDDDNDELNYSIKTNPKFIDLQININSLIETSFTLSIPKIKSDDNVEISKLHKDIISHKSKINSLETIISNLNKQLAVFQSREFIYTIPEYYWQKTYGCGCTSRCGCNQINYYICYLMMSSNIKKIVLNNCNYQGCYLMSVDGKYIELKDYRHINKIKHNLDEFEIASCADPNYELPMMNINIRKIIIIGKIQIGKFFDREEKMEVEEIEIQRDSVSNISLYFDKIRGLKTVKIVNSPNLKSGDVGLRRKYSFDIIYV